MHATKSNQHCVAHTHQLRLIPSAREINLDKVQRSQLENSASYVIYQFTCSCGDIYIGRTDRQLTPRMSEHIPKWLTRSTLLGSPKRQPSNIDPSSSIAKHILATDHTVDPISSFQPALRNLNSKLLAFIHQITQSITMFAKSSDAINPFIMV